MITFSQFLVELDISEDNLGRLISAIERRLPKLLGAKLYRFGGTNGIEKLNGGVSGYTYFVGSTKKAFRIRVSSGKVVGIDIWKRYYGNKSPDYTTSATAVHIGSILASLTKLAAIIKNPSATKIEASVNEDISDEETQLDEMASRSSPEEFYRLMVKEYGEGVAQAATVAQIKAVATKYDKLMPTIIFRDKNNFVGGRGDDKKFNTNPNASSHGSSSNEVHETPSNQTTITFVTASQDASTFTSKAANSEAQHLYKTATKMATGPATSNELKDPETLYGHMSQLVSMACKGSLRSLLIYGGPGTGKCVCGDTIINVKTMKDIDEAHQTQGSSYI
jgi:hypothetical protein